MRQICLSESTFEIHQIQGGIFDEAGRFPNFNCYHYLIFADSTIWQTNGPREYLWHAMGYNLTSLGICFVDIINNNQPTEAALNSGKKLVQLL